MVIESSLSSEELEQRIRVSLVRRQPFIPAVGLCGRASNACIHVTWATGWFSDSFAPVFRGRIEGTACASRIVGHMTHHPIAQVFFDIWCAGLIFVAVLGVWTVIMPLGCWGLLWMANGMLAVGDQLYPNRRVDILNCLPACASGAGTSS